MDDFYVESDVYIVIRKDNYDIAILTGSRLSLNSIDDNVDVEIRFKNGNLYTATFFTIQNIKTLFDKNKLSGECDSGVYFQCSDMILVETLSPEVIVKTIENLIGENCLDSAFTLQK